MLGRKTAMKKAEAALIAVFILGLLPALLSGCEEKRIERERDISTAADLADKQFVTVLGMAF